MGTSHHSNSFRNSAVDRQCDIRWANDLGNDPGYRALRADEEPIEGRCTRPSSKGAPGKAVMVLSGEDKAQFYRMRVPCTP
jgi:hypothetical protein